MTRLKELTEVAFRAAHVAMNEDCAAAILRGENGQLPRGVLIIAYDAVGAFRICGNGLPVHEGIGILQRCCMSLHESVAVAAADMQTVDLIRFAPPSPVSADPPVEDAEPQKTE